MGHPFGFGCAKGNKHNSRSLRDDNKKNKGNKKDKGSKKDKGNGKCECGGSSPFDFAQGQNDTDSLG
jgi:hypothetical protein